MHHHPACFFELFSGGGRTEHSSVRSRANLGIDASGPHVQASLHIKFKMNLQIINEINLEIKITMKLKRRLSLEK